VTPELKVITTAAKAAVIKAKTKTEKSASGISAKLQQNYG